MSSYVLTVTKQGDNYCVIEGAFVKSLAARSYLVDDDYDFGSICPKDLVVSLYKGEVTSEVGITAYG